MMRKSMRRMTAVTRVRMHTARIAPSCKILIRLCKDPENRIVPSCKSNPD